MGVYHFMGLGRAVGVVTCAVDYLEKSHDAIEKNCASSAVRRMFRGSGGIAHEERSKGSVEAVVLFTSREVIRRELTAYPYRGCARPGAVRNEVARQLATVWRRYDPQQGRKIYWCELEDIDDFRSTFRRVVQVTYRVSQPGKVGKEIWCNLTGGTNAINLSLMSMAQLTGKVRQHYLLGQGHNKEFQKEVRVPGVIDPLEPNQDGYFNLVPVVKTVVDIDGFYIVLNALADLDEPVKASDLLSILQQDGRFIDMKAKEFVRVVLLRMHGRYTEYDPETGTTSISDEGKEFLNNELVELQELRPTPDIVERSKSWDWLTEETL